VFIVRVTPTPTATRHSLHQRKAVAMEPLSPHRPVIPKMHLLLSPPLDQLESRDEDLRAYSTSERQPLHPAVNRSATATSQTARASTAVVVPVHLSTPGKVLPARVYGSSVTYMDSPMLPPVRPITTIGRAQYPAATTSNDSEFHVLHPSLDLSDETGELSRLMLSKWSVHSGEQQFSSVSLFCEMKLGEAKRMASWVEAPNRFFTVACCQLLEKFISRLDTSVNMGNGKARSDTGSVHGASFLQKVFVELIASIFMPGSGDYSERLPFFIVHPLLSSIVASYDVLMHLLLLVVAGA
jgi:hypothetical protein